MRVATPTLDEVRSWIGVPVQLLTDDQLQQIVDAELAKQAAYCLVPPEFPAALAQGLYRRVARECASRSLPLGLTGDAYEYGPTRLPMWDAQIESHEAPYRITAIA